MKGLFENYWRRKIVSGDFDGVSAAITEPRP